MGIGDIFKIGSIKKENENLLLEIKSMKVENNKLSSVLDEVGAGDIITVKNVIKEYENIKQKLKEDISNLEIKEHNISNEIKSKESEIIVLDEELLLESFALYKPKFSFLTSDEYKERLSIIREKQKDLIKNGTAASGNQNLTFNNSASQGKKMANDMIKLLLRSFNNECDYCIEHVKFNNIDTNVKRIEKSFEVINKLGKIMQISLLGEYKKLKIDELFLSFEYQRKKQEEKEAQKKTREELKEQQKLEQEVKLVKEKINKERKHFSQAIKRLEEQVKDTTDSNEKKAIEEKMVEIQTQFEALDDEEKLVDYRLKNAKAGYVYIISNIGSFGENVYKIGMTRRLEPMDRVDELGDASVPFTFDVHALIFSEDAPSLETKLHEHFFNNRVNKLNNRKEFFTANIDEIEKIVKDNYDKIVDFIKEPAAEQYREGLKTNHENKISKTT